MWGMAVAFNWPFFVTYFFSMLVMAGWISSHSYRKDYAGQVDEIFERTVRKWGYEDVTRRLRWSAERGDGVLVYGLVGGRRVVRRRERSELLKRWTMVWGVVRYEWRIKVERWTPSGDEGELMQEMEMLPKYEPRGASCVTVMEVEEVEMRDLHVVVDVELAAGDEDREGRESQIPPPSYA
jgi:hypothetical protein